MFSQPASCIPQVLPAASARSRHGGNLARVRDGAGPFNTSLRASYRVSCGIRLSRDARSVSGAGPFIETGNRAIRMKQWRVRSRSSALLTRHLSTTFGEAAQKPRAHHANRHQPVALPSTVCMVGAPVPVMRHPARLRDLRKPHLGGCTVLRQYIDKGLWAYRVIV